MTVTATPPRPPLGLPAGSIRGILALQIAIIFWMLLLAPNEDVVPIPLNLYFLLAMVMIFFVSHGKSIARRADDEPSPLWLPGGSLRFLLLAGTGAVFAYLAVKHPDRFNRLTPQPSDLESWKYYLSALGIGFVLGYATRVLPFRHGWAFQAFQAWTAIIVMAILFIHLVFEVIIHFSIPHLIDAVAWQTIVTGVVAYYFASRS